MNAAKTQKSERSTPDIRLVSRITAILRTLSESQVGLSLGGIAAATGLPRPTVQRLIDSMEAEGLVARTSAGASIRLGQEIARLGTSMNQDVRKFFRPIIEEIGARSNEAVDLTVLHPHGAVVIDQVASPRALRVVSRPGLLLPLHATASGKAHLAQLSLDMRMTALRAPLPALTSATITDRDALLAQIASTPAGGAYFDRAECFEDICAVGIDLGTTGLGNLAIAISMPSARFVEAEAHCTHLLTELRAELSR